MKKVNSIQLILSSIIITLLLVSFINGTDIPWLNGQLNGPVIVKMTKEINGVNGRTLEGEYENNQKVGVWKLYDEEHNLLQTRKYNCDFDYSIIKDNKVVSTVTTMRRGSDKLYAHDELQANNIASSQRIWKIINPESLKNNNMLNYSLARIEFNEFTAYTNEDLSEKDLNNTADKVDFSKITNIRIMGDWYFESKKRIAQYEILAISPVLEDDSTTLWYYYPDLRKSLSKIEVESLNRMVLNLDDLLCLGDYPSTFYKVEGLPDEAFSDDMKDIQTKAILEDLLRMEAALWIK